MSRYRIVAIDQTESWCDPAVRACGRVWGIYAYDLEERTFCCEMTPSRFLLPVEDVVERLPEDEAEREKVHDALMRGTQETEPCYMHVSRVDSMELGEEYEVEDEDMDLETWVQELRANGDAIPQPLMALLD